MHCTEPLPTCCICQARDTNKNDSGGRIDDTTKGGRDLRRRKRVCMRMLLTWCMLDWPAVSTLTQLWLRIFFAREAYMSEIRLCVTTGTIRGIPPPPTPVAWPNEASFVQLRRSPRCPKIKKYKNDEIEVGKKKVGKVRKGFAVFSRI